MDPNARTGLRTACRGQTPACDQLHVRYEEPPFDMSRCQIGARPSSEVQQHPGSSNSNWNDVHDYYGAQYGEPILQHQDGSPNGRGWNKI
ncbi:hypothetical protein CPSG_08371 [Coccidioides posadasii str. Silveira]|uniref:Uncharacterized protein n=1 Tax=Coccidioides posadasii (strain RMSCC 757 / Silveira) TaxID=443226 RepID=E9DEX1_COCPS|nr:hypothetical protein CPSG_08371 [Coccidioides posadasii str. Silveira]